jgi:hypothetical protein
VLFRVDTEYDFMSDCRNVRQALAKYGLLVLQDKVLTSIVGIMTGESLSTSWWSHAKGQAIFTCLEQLEEDDVLTTRLVSGRVTFVDRALWPDFLAVATSGGAWQTLGLSADAKKLLRAVTVTPSLRSKGRAARELQERLLVHAQEVHTTSGRHEIALQPWSEWPKRQDIDRDIAVDVARHALEEAVINIGGTAKLLPWHRFAKEK